MKLFIILVALAMAASEEDFDEERDKRQSAFYQNVQSRASTLPQKFRLASVTEYEDEGISRNTVTPTPQPQYRRPSDSQTAYQHNVPVRGQLVQVRRPQVVDNRQQQQADELLEEELEEDKPDRLSLLLPNSKFDCTNKKTGYYADDGLNCEVFHYCQDNARHSWICPEGFLFHQVHLICMPPSGDNICEQSSQFHFVNDYLYRPVNAEEAQTKPNVTLRYSERYYPDNYYEEGEIRPAPVQVVPIQQPQLQRVPVVTVAPRAKPVQFQQTLRPQQFITPQTVRPQQFVTPQVVRQPVSNQVFHSPEEVNIPLQHRRPVATTAAPQRTYQPSRDEDEYEYDDPPYRG